WGQDEYGNRVRNLSFQLSRTLYVNVEYQIETLPPGAVEHTAMRPIIVPEHVGMLQELSVGHARFKLIPGNEVIRLAFALQSTRRPRRIGDREGESRNVFQEPVHQRRLPRSGRRGNDKNNGHVQTDLWGRLIACP